jgi:regulatory protein
VASEGAGPLELATAALARRDYSAAELRAYLEQRGVDGGDAARAVERLEAAHYVDDARAAAARAEALAARGYGDAFIRADLAQRGVDRERIDEAVSGLEPERDRAAALVASLRPPSHAARRLLTKGFDPETVETVTPEAS